MAVDFSDSKLNTKYKNMRITIFLILTIFFAGQTVFSQYISEHKYNFDYEINEILLQTDKGETSRIICKFKIFVQPHKKKDFKDLVEFEFLNDTIIMALTYWEYKDYWVNRSGKLVNIDYDQENSVVIKDKSPFIDSAGYKVYSAVISSVKDTTYYYTREKIYNEGKSVESINKSTSSTLGSKTTMYKKDSFGDTSYTYVYELINGDWKLIYDAKEWKVLTNSKLVDAPAIMTRYTYDTNGDITKSVTTSKSVFAYDGIGRLITVTQFYFLDFDEKLV